MITKKVKEATILFAGDSGDGMQLTGGQFTNTSAHFGNDLRTFPDFPAEIRAPMGTIAGVSGFQINFGSSSIYSIGDRCDVLVAMNAAALKKNLHKIKKNGIIIVNTSGFNKKNLKLAQYDERNNPLENDLLAEYELYKIDVTRITKEALIDIDLNPKSKDRAKNMFVLGFIYWMYNRKLDITIDFLNQKFKSNPAVLEANIKVLKAGYYYGDTVEAFSARFQIDSADMSRGEYRNITGNEAIALGMISAAKKSELGLFYGGYPITPASDILHYLSKYKNFGIKTFQAEDEIAGITSAIGASFAGNIGTTASSGPGIALKTEALGLAVMLELPLLVVNVQRGGPSTGLPTKTEQSDLFQAMYGRNGEAPIPILAAKSPSDCFEKAYKAMKIAIEYMTPVFLLSDGYLANGSEPWRFPKYNELEGITKNIPHEKKHTKEGKYLPYIRDENLVRSWAMPGTSDFQHRIGGLEKEIDTGNVSYDTENHQKMVDIRAKKVRNVQNMIPLQELDRGNTDAKVLLLTWGSTYGSVKVATNQLIEQGYKVAHLHIEYINPFPKNLGELLDCFDKIVVPEMNSGQLAAIIKNQFPRELILFSKIKGVPFNIDEIVAKVKEVY